MALRTFTADDGRTWTVWLVRPTQSTKSRHGVPAEWLAFQTDDESERRRLRDVPPGWEELPDYRLEQLRGMAEIVTRRARPGAADRDSWTGAGP
jgi:hypothetical protein